jgi:hypothetical protein
MEHWWNCTDRGKPKGRDGSRVRCPTDHVSNTSSEQLREPWHGLDWWVLTDVSEEVTASITLLGFTVHTLDNYAPHTVLSKHYLISYKAFAF